MTDELDERTAWLVLAGVDGVGPETHAWLVGAAGGAVRALSLARMRRLPRVPDRRPLAPAVVEALAAAAGDPDGALRGLEDHDVWTLTPLDEAYPARLRVIDPAPPALYGWGRPGALSADRAVAVVGTRRPTPVGRSIAARVAARLVEAGATVVSGLAVGIDGVAHAATVDARGTTVAVLGAGHAQPGPRAHRALARRIVETGGAVVSESPPHVRATRGTFPRRNRIVSALGDATLVIEAPARSGALITARHALEQGRPVFAAPGRPFDAAVAGCLALLRETEAGPLVGLDELIVDLGFTTAAGTEAQAPQLSRRDALALLAEAERSVAARLCRAPAGPDALAMDTDLPPGIVAAALTLLQLRGWAQPSGGVYLPAGPLLRDL